MHLRPITSEDLPRLFDIQNDAEAHRIVGFTRHGPDDRAAYMAHWATVLPNPEVITRLVEVDGQILGSMACFSRNGRREVGGWFAREAWGRGLATAALAAFLTHFEGRPLHAACRTEHHASRRVLEKVGFHHLGPLPESPEHLLLELKGSGAFRSTLFRVPGKGGWTFAPVPPEHAPTASEAWGRTPVIATFDGHSWATSVWRDRTHGCLLPVPARLRGAKGHGDEAWIALAPAT